MKKYKLHSIQSHYFVSKGTNRFGLSTSVSGAVFNITQKLVLTYEILDGAVTLVEFDSKEELIKQYPEWFI